MTTDVNTEAAVPKSGNEIDACPLDLPFTGRVPAILSLATIPGAVLASPMFFGLAGGLLAVISLLLSPKRCRLIGAIALIGSIAAASAGLHFAH